MKKGVCPTCGGHLAGDPEAFEWWCSCGDVFTDDELAEARQEADNPS